MCIRDSFSLLGGVSLGVLVLALSGALEDAAKGGFKMAAPVVQMCIRDRCAAVVRSGLIFQVFWIERFQQVDQFLLLMDIQLGVDALARCV